VITSNAKTIIKNIDKLVKVQSKNTTEALEEIGHRGTGIIKGNSPTVTSRLKNSMSYTINGKVKDYEESQSDAVRAIRSKKEVIIGTNVIYGPSVEYLSQKGAKGFMLKSYKQLIPIANKIFQTILGKGLK